MALVTRLGAERAVVIFSKSTCCMCHTIKTLICSFGANPMVHELDEHPYGQQIERELKALECKPSVPAVFIGQELIGGPNEIMSLHLKGKLVPLLKKANAIMGLRMSPNFICYITVIMLTTYIAFKL